MVIAFGGDHAALETKNMLMQLAAQMGHMAVDCGAFDTNAVDYPDVAVATCEKVANGQADRAVLICGTGIGMSISANKVLGIRCAHCTEALSAKLAREHNNANVLAVGARITGAEMLKEIFVAFIDTQEQGGRHAIRVEKINNYDKMRG